MKMAWKIGVKIHAIVLSGSLPGTAGQRLCGSGLDGGPAVCPGGGDGVGEGTTLGHGAVPAGVGDGAAEVSAEAAGDDASPEACGPAEAGASEGPWQAGDALGASTEAGAADAG